MEPRARGGCAEPGGALSVLLEVHRADAGLQLRPHTGAAERGLLQWVSDADGDGRLELFDGTRLWTENGAGALARVQAIPGEVPRPC